MTFKTLIFRNLTRNTRSYGAYFFSSLFSVFVFFIFSLLFYHPQLGDSIQASSDTISQFSKIGLQVSQVVIVLLSFIFLWYTFSVFLHSRKRDFSIYLTLGMGKSDLKKLIFFENLALGTIATTLGTFLGLLFSKVILLVSQKLLHLTGGLNFYWPWKAMILSFVVFFIIFVCISLFSLFRLQTEELASMAKEEDKGQPEPKVNGFFALLSFLFIGLGYLSVWLFASDAIISEYSLLLLFSCVICTIIGTFLFFSQGSILILKRLKKHSLFFKGTNMLTISELVFRMKDNAMMYSLIAIVSSVAFVGIGLTAVLGSSDFGNTQGNTAAYVYVGYGLYGEENNKQSGTDYHKNNLAFIRKELNKTGEPIFEDEVTYLYSPLLRPSGSEIQLSFPVISLSAYTKLSKGLNLPKLTMQDNQVFLFTNSNSDLNTVKKQTEEQRTSDYSAKINKKDEVLTVTKIPVTLNLSILNLSVVSDTLYNRFLEHNQSENDSSVYQIELFHFDKWMDYPEIDKTIMSEMEKRQDSISSDDESSEEEQAQKYFMVDSLYSTWQNARQANGLILMIGILLGSVFFSFSASILYFRLFGDLDRDGRYHRSLYVLGVSEKDRHTIVRKEMLLMYFPPVAMAIAHFGIAFLALTTMIGRDATFIWLIYLKIIGIYFVFLVLFYLISKARYLKHLDKLAEPIR